MCVGSFVGFLVRRSLPKVAETALVAVWLWSNYVLVCTALLQNVLSLQTEACKLNNG